VGLPAATRRRAWIETPLESILALMTITKTAATALDAGDLRQPQSDARR
jgi:hypothetical protein